MDEHIVTDIAGSTKSAARLSSSSLSPSPSPKRSRRSVEKRVVSIPIAEAEVSRAKGASETAPPSDSWAWRKYGQKPIKGSPYPRGYYRCSSSKGCPARKQVERSRVDPTMLVVTYSCEHNHSWPLPKNNSNSRSAPAAAVKEDPHPDPDPIRHDSPPESDPADPEVEEKFSDFMAMPMPDDFWFSDVGSTSSTSPPNEAMLFGPIFSSELALDDCAKSGAAAAVDGEDDGLFDGLGELPEYSVVFRWSYMERQMAAG